jgi:hypothetical protein
MHAIFIIALSLHLLAGIFWAGTSFTLATTGGVGGERLFRLQMIAAAIAIVAGLYLWNALNPEGKTGMILGLGGLCAIAAAGVQGAMGARATRELRNGQLSQADARARIATAQGIASILLVVTIVCMAAARYI